MRLSRALEKLLYDRFGGMVATRSLRLDYSYLVAIQRRGFRNGNWFRLELVDRGLFRCALWVAKVRRRIKNFKRIMRVLAIASKLLTTLRSRIYGAGSVRASKLLCRFNVRGLFEWAPHVRDWLKDSRYIFYLDLEEFWGLSTCFFACT